MYRFFVLQNINHCSVFQIAQKYDLVIVEDDPYYFLQFDTKVA